MVVLKRMSYYRQLTLCEESKEVNSKTCANQDYWYSRYRKLSSQPFNPQVDYEERYAKYVRATSVVKKSIIPLLTIATEQNLDQYLQTLVMFRMHGAVIINHIITVCLPLSLELHRTEVFAVLHSYTELYLAEEHIAPMAQSIYTQSQYYTLNPHSLEVIKKYFPELTPNMAATNVQPVRARRQGNQSEMLIPMSIGSLLYDVFATYENIRLDRPTTITVIELPAVIFCDSLQLFLSLEIDDSYYVMALQYEARQIIAYYEARPVYFSDLTKVYARYNPDINNNKLQHYPVTAWRLGQHANLNNMLLAVLPYPRAVPLAIYMYYQYSSRLPFAQVQAFLQHNLQHDDHAFMLLTKIVVSPSLGKYPMAARFCVAVDYLIDRTDVVISPGALWLGTYQYQVPGMFQVGTIHPMYAAYKTALVDYTPGHIAAHTYYRALLFSNPVTILQVTGTVFIVRPQVAYTIKYTTLPAVTMQVVDLGVKTLKHFTALVL